MPTLLLAGLAVLASAGTPVNAAVLRADLGYSHLFTVGDPDLDPVAMHGVGVDLFGGYELGWLNLTPELQVGCHLFPSHRRERGFDVDTVWVVTPILGGARYQLDVPELPIRGHVAAHLGMVYQYWEREILGVRGSGSGIYFGFNAGVGGDWMLTDELGVGASVRYSMVLSQNEEIEDSGNGHMISAAAHITVTL